MNHPLAKAVILAVAFLGISSLLYSNLVHKKNNNGEKRAVSGFTSIVVKGFGKVFLSQGSAESLEIKGNKDIVKEIKSHVEDGILTIEPTTANVPGGDAIEYYVTINDIQAITLDDKVRAKTQGEFDIKDLSVTMNGKTKAALAVRGNSLTASIGGSSDLLITGVIETEKVDVKDEGRFEGAGLFSQNSQVSTNGNAKVWVNAMENLKASASGNSVIRYGGEPKVEKSTSGSGQVLGLE